MIKILFILMFGLYASASSIVLPDNFQADFTQQITNPKKKVLHYSGNVHYSNNMLRWAYIQPTKKEVCSDTKEMTIVDHDLEQVSHYRIKKGFNFPKILKNAKLHSKNIYVAKYENKSYTIQVDDKQRLQSIAFFDDLDNKVQIVFKEVKYAKGYLSKQKMMCSVPKGYDIIRG